MRILIVSEEPPIAPYNGLRLALGAVLDILRDHHQVRVVALDATREGDDPDWLRVVPRPAGRATALGRWYRFLLRGRPLRTDEFVEALAPAVTDELHRFDPDLVHVVSDRLAGIHRVLGDRPRLLSALDAPHLNVEARAALRRGPARWALRAQAARLRRFVTREFPAYEAVVLVTPEDGEAVRSLAPTATTAVVPNGVDAHAFAADWTGSAANRLTFHGAMHYAPNVDAAVHAAREILPRVRREVPDAQLAVVGWNPAPAVLALQELPGVMVTGAVDEIAPWLHTTGVYLCPMRQGTGMKNKLLEAMAAGAPCVATPLAMQGIAATEGRDVLVGADADQLARLAVRLLRDRPLAERLGGRGRARVTEHHTWARSAGAYLELYEQVTGAREPTDDPRRGPGAR